MAKGTNSFIDRLQLPVRDVFPVDTGQIGDGAFCLVRETKTPADYDDLDATNTFSASVDLFMDLGSVVITWEEAGVPKSATDDGAGGFTGDAGVGATVVYKTGQIDFVTLTTANFDADGIAAGVDVRIAYNISPKKFRWDKAGGDNGGTQKFWQREVLDAEFRSELGFAFIDDLGDADTTTVVPLVGDTLAWNGTNWVPSSSQGTSNNYVFAYNKTYQSIVAANVDQDFLWTHTGQINGWTHNIATGEFTCNQTGQYAATMEFNVEVTSGGGGTSEDAWIFAELDGSEIIGSQQGISINHADTSLSISRTYLFNATDGQLFKTAWGGTDTIVHIAPAHNHAALPQETDLTFPSGAATGLGSVTFTLNSPLQKYLFWIDVDNLSTPPTPASDEIAIEVNVSSGNTAAQVANAVEAAILAIVIDDTDIFNASKPAPSSPIVNVSNLTIAGAGFNEYSGAVDDTVITNNSTPAMSAVVTQQGTKNLISATLTIRRLT